MEAPINKKRKTVLNTVAVIAVILTAAVVFFAYFPSHNSNDTTGWAMGSEIKIQLYGFRNDSVADEILERISDTENNHISRYKESSEIYKLNSGTASEVSVFTSGELKTILNICEKSGGALDITLGGLSDLWDFDSAKNTVPEQAEIEKLQSYSGYEKVRVDGNTVTLGENQLLDLGAVGKGLACDMAQSVLQTANVRRALVSVGGSVLTHIGSETVKQDFTIGIRAPEKDDFSPFMTVKLTGTNFISTSGNYEKYFEADGITYHHILDPETGYPADSGLKSVTIISDSGLYSDALSTACFVLGIEKSEDLLKEYNAEAIFVDNESNVYVPASLIDSCTLLNDNYKVLSYE